MADLINREAALYAVRVGALSTSTLYGRTEEGETARKEIERLIKDLPRVEVAEKVGKIIRLSRCDKCSLCGYEEGRYSHFFNYCPNCGARMVVDEPVDEKIESVDECRFLCRWNKDYKCTKGHYERWCKDKMFGEEKEEAIKEKIEAEERGF